MVQYKDRRRLYYVWKDLLCVRHIIPDTCGKEISLLCGPLPSRGFTPYISVRTSYKKCSVCENIYAKISDSEFQLCAECGFDHALQPDQSYNAHMNLIARSIAGKCIDFSRAYKAVRISRTAIDRQIRFEIRTKSATLNPMSISDKVRLILKDEGIGVKDEEQEA